MKKVIYVISSVLILSSCGSGEKNDKKAELDKLKKEQADLKEKISKLETELAVNDSSAAKSKLVTVKEAEPQEFDHYIEVQAKVEGDEDILLSPETMGTVTSVRVKPGDKVTTGQVLATLDDKMVQQSIGELQSQLDLTTQLYNRQKNLWDQKIGSEVQFLQAKTNKEAMERRMGSLQEQLAMTRITSPINGTVDDVEIKIGQTVSPGIPAVRVVNLNSLKVKGEVAESFINEVQKGDDAILYFPDQQKELKVKIDYSGNRIDPVNRTFNVEVRLKDNSKDFKPNMVAIMKIVDYKNPKAFVVPMASVQKSTDGQFIYVAETENGKTVAKRKVVQTGKIYNGTTEIISGLTPGDKIITNGFQNVIEGDLIQY